MHQRPLFAQRQARRHRQRQAQRLDQERPAAQKVRNDVPAEDGLDLGDAGVEREGGVDLDEEGGGDGEDDLGGGGEGLAGAGEARVMGVGLRLTARMM
jgi:hypothetical protein